MNVLLTLTDPRQCGQCADALFTQYGYVHTQRTLCAKRKLQNWY